MLNSPLFRAEQRGNRRARRYALGMSCLFLLSTLLFIPGCDLFGGGDDRYLMGQLIWSHDLPDYLGKDYSVNTTQPLIDGEVVYAVGAGKLFSLELADGTVRWQRSLSGPHFSDNMVHDAEALYIVHNRLVEAYNKHDGTRRWQMSDGLSVRFGGVLIQTEMHVYPSDTDGEVGRVRKRDGVVDQRITLTDLKPENDEQTSGTLMHTDDNYLYVPTSYYEPGAPDIGGNVLAYDASTGDYRWGYEVPMRRVPVPGYPGNYWMLGGGAEEGVVWGSFVIISASSSVIALDRFSGELRWQQTFEESAGFWLGMALVDDVVYVGATDGIIYALDPETGEVLRESQVGGSIITLFAVDEGRIYLTTTTARIAILDAGTGQVLWESLAPDDKASGGYSEFLSPVAVGNGYMVNVGSKKIYCLAAR